MHVSATPHQSLDELALESPIVLLCPGCSRAQIAPGYDFAKDGPPPSSCGRGCKDNRELRTKMWRQDSHYPRTEVHVAFPALNETFRCSVLKQPEPNCFAVRLNNDSVYDRSIWCGCLYLANWDTKTIHGITGRPVLTAVRPLPYVKGEPISESDLPWAQPIRLAS